MNGDDALKCQLEMGEFLCTCKLYSQSKIKNNKIMYLLACNSHSIISSIVNKLS